MFFPSASSSKRGYHREPSIISQNQASSHRTKHHLTPPAWLGVLPPPRREGKGRFLQRPCLARAPKGEEATAAPMCACLPSQRTRPRRASPFAADSEDPACGFRRGLLEVVVVHWFPSKLKQGTPNKNTKQTHKERSKHTHTQTHKHTNTHKHTDKHTRTNTNTNTQT